MKRICFILTVIFISLTANAQGWDWAKRIGGNNIDIGNSICTDANGNIYVTGLFKSDSIIFGNTTLTHLGFDGIFIVKYDISGNILWAKGISGLGAIYSNSICSDSNSNVYITGQFTTNSITFDNITLTNNGSTQNIFIVKYDSLGNVLWADCPQVLRCGHKYEVVLAINKWKQ